eukprot:TRINITY_DN120_c0_g1_i1.p1 TRINITY_DN120_c0_g1~~TRINITY_DN120_c0_g1_i1.p1  ORF type:complete len:539 (+),score=148.03 TRINITY_DN120_c0_g1_i1:139-1755(+)
MEKSVRVTVFFLILGFHAVLGDLPVHCLRSQVMGKWKIKMMASTKVSSGHQMTCGHSEPGDPSSSLRAMKGKFKTDSSFLLHLRDDDTVSVEDSRVDNGRWTMVYDEGFAFNVGQKKYFAFSKYFKQDGQFLSDCSKTLVGWYNDAQTGEWGCYRGKKLLGDGESKSDYINKQKEQKNVVQPKDTFSDSFLQISSSTFLPVIPPPSVEMLELHSGFTEHSRFVEKFNKVAQKSWEASVHPAFEGMSIKELNQRAGRRKFSSFVEVGRVEEKKKKEKSNVSDLPKEFSWEEYLPPIAEQKDCGSCYAIATMGMLSARLKIKHNENVNLAPQHVLDCSYYNQGCGGGYPFLVEKFGSEFELVPEDCHPYTAKNGKCSDSCDPANLPKIYKVKNYRFIGGAYGKANERDMMLEIKKNGPIVVSFEPGYDFMMYKKGVYHSVNKADWKAQGLPKPEWEKVDHSVLCYGWGEENGEKYWMLQNSWGEMWGDNGRFKMRRGTDESAIESLAEAADPYVVEQDENNFVQVPNDPTVSLLRFNDDE